MLDYLFEDPETRFPKAMEMVDKAAPRTLFPSQREAFRNAIDEKNNWYQLLMKIAHLNPEVRNRLVKSFLIDSNLMVWGEQEKNRDKYQCNIPWAILLDPTSACNLHCTGCWAAEYGHKLNELRRHRLYHRTGQSLWERTCSSIRAASPWCANTTSSSCARRIPIARFSALRTPRLSTRRSAKT